MSATPIVFLILAVYAAVMFFYACYASRRTQSFQDVISASGQATSVMLAGSIVATQIGSGFLIGGAEYGAVYGIGGAWYGVACALAGLVGVAMSRFVFTHKFLSLSDYFLTRYPSVATRLIYSVSAIFSGLSLVAGQLLAARSVFSTLGISPAAGVVLIALAALVYTNTAGLWGTMKISTFQSVVIFCGMAAAIGVVLYAHGFGFLSQTLPPAAFDPMPYDSETLVSITVPLLLASSVNQFAFQSVNSMRTLRDARAGYLLSSAVLLPVAFIPPLLGMFGRALFPQLAPEKVFPTLLLTQLPVPVAAVILSAILCAVVISCNTGYIMVATNAVHDIYQGMLRPDADSRTCRRLMLAVDSAVFLAGVVIALRMNDIIQILSLGYSLLSAGCLVPFFGGVVWKRGTAAGALAAACTGIAATLVSSFGLVHIPYVSITSVLLSAAAYVLVSLATRRNAASPETV